ncbi:dihydropteroate synthase [Asticcacaulis sp. ZE23SCel15]|uniref:dihydropteroate synthase n=1 Tax=Asticcacaulis sp. ZE23SCel15 TaxID=3059027 RepID=UPI00265E761A|nr:dihydropteroate synthase [Asticcacaulis sp. ZE23SCel15]WKL59003.1 dihydropteroate synthase [Asticcacaulis sp. ZE23SCel15]
MTLSDLNDQTGPLIMGVVNVTPDSFSDGGRFFLHASAIEQAKSLIEAGADVLDIGGESTRPGAIPVSIADEIARVVPVIEGLRKDYGVPISIDTFKQEVARAAVAAGATIWNDIRALEGEGSLEAATELNCDIILMHMKGDPQTMQSEPRYDDVVAEVKAYLLARAEAAMSAGVARERIWLDPGIGFGKTLDHNLSLIRATGRLAAHGFPLLMAASRKRFIAALEEREGADPSTADERIGGTIAVHLKALELGAKMVRVHDVKAMKQAIRTWKACL